MSIVDAKTVEANPLAQVQMAGRRSRRTDPPKPDPLDEAMAESIGRRWEKLLGPGCAVTATFDEMVNTARDFHVASGNTIWPAILFPQTGWLMLEGEYADGQGPVFVPASSCKRWEPR